MWEGLSDLNDGHHVGCAYRAGRDGGPPCGHAAKLELAALIEQHGDIDVDQLRRRLRCRCVTEHEPAPSTINAK